MASDLISRTAAIAEVEQWAEHGYDTIHWTGIKAMLEVQPAVDAAPVVHARWIASDRYRGYMCCSHCTDAYVAPAWLDEGKWKYCPACGARMDGGEP